MGDDDKSRDLVRVKADATGIDFALGSGFPGAIARLLPPSLIFRRSAERIIGEGILAKLKMGGGLDDAEMAFAESALSENVSKYLRLKKITARAIEVRAVATDPVRSLRSPAQRTLPPSSTDDHGATRTADDWLNKFREDASLVDDELVQEIYARVLSREDLRPKSFSIRTLGVLRDLDRDTAIIFGRLQKAIMDGMVVPQQGHGSKELYGAIGITHDDFIVLDDAGLVNSGLSSFSEAGGDMKVIAFAHRKALRCKTEPGYEVSLSVHILTPAGAQLSKIAEIDPDETAFDQLAEWFRLEAGVGPIYVASLPDENWSSDMETLDWLELAPKPNSATAG